MSSAEAMASPAGQKRPTLPDPHNRPMPVFVFKGVPHKQYRTPYPQCARKALAGETVPRRFRLLLLDELLDSDHRRAPPAASDSIGPPPFTVLAVHMMRRMRLNWLSMIVVALGPTRAPPEENGRHHGASLFDPPDRMCNPTNAASLSSSSR